MLISDTINFENIDLTEDIEKNLAHLKTCLRFAKSYIVDIEDQIKNIIESYKLVGTEESVESLEDDVEYANKENVSKNIDDLELKVINSSSIEGAGDAINRYYSNELWELKNAKSKVNTDVVDLLSLENTTQTESSKLAVLMDSYESTVVNGMSVSNAFKETEELIQSQLNLSSISVSPDLLEKIDTWNEDLEYYKESFMLTDKGTFDSKNALDSVFDKTNIEYENGIQLSNILPSDYSNNMSGLLQSVSSDASLTNQLSGILSQLPSNWASMNPLALTANYSSQMNALVSQLSNLQSLGQLPAQVASQFAQLPNNITDMVSTIAGNLPINVQDQLGSVINAINGLSSVELSSLLQKVNISDALKNLPSLDKLSEMVNLGNLSQLGNVSSQISNLVGNLQNFPNISSLPGNLSSVISNLPSGFGNMLGGIGGVPGISQIQNLSSQLTGQISNVMGSVTGIVNNVSNLANSALSSLGSLASLGSFGSLFGSGSSAQPGEPVPPILW